MHINNNKQYKIQYIDTLDHKNKNHNANNKN